MATSGWNYCSVTRQQFYFLDHPFNRSSDVIAAITHDPRQNSVELTVMPFDNDALIDIQSLLASNNLEFLHHHQLNMLSQLIQFTPIN